jgi:hypothetical protein
MAAVAFALTAIGPGSISLDDALGIEWAGPDWAIGSAAAAGLGAVVLLALRRIGHRARRHEAQAVEDTRGAPLVGVPRRIFASARSSIRLTRSALIPSREPISPSFSTGLPNPKRASMISRSLSCPRSARS